MKGHPDVLRQLNAVLATEQMPADYWQQDSSRIISLRYYALLRARQPDPAYTNQQRYEMGSKQFDATGDHYRRLLVSSTIYFHNAAL